MYLELATGQVGIFIPSKFCWSGEIGRHIVFRTLRAQAHVGSSPASSTNKELSGIFGGYKRTAQSADQGFFGGIAREFRISCAQARSVFSPRNRCEPKISLAQTFFAKRSESEAILSND